MNKYFTCFAITFLALFTSIPLIAGSAYWTGRSEVVQTVTYRTAWKCEYNYNGKTIYQLFDTSCPSSITVETPQSSDYQNATSGYPTNSAKAYWSGESAMVQDSNYQMVWKCGYNYSGQKIYKLFRTSCPSSIDVQ